jgi:hypothetical protein
MPSIVDRSGWDVNVAGGALDYEPLGGTIGSPLAQSPGPEASTPRPRGHGLARPGT